MVPSLKLSPPPKRSNENIAQVVDLLADHTLIEIRSFPERNAPDPSRPLIVDFLKLKG